MSSESAKVLTVVVLSGLRFSGKTHYFKFLREKTRLGNLEFLPILDIPAKVLGVQGESLPEQRVFRKTLWLEVERGLVLERKSLLVEMALTTTRDHWLPLLQTIAEAQGHLQEMKRIGRIAEEHTINLKVITFFSSLEVLARRIALHVSQGGSDDNICDVKSFAGTSGVQLFELPAPGMSHAIDTSNGSESQIRSNADEIISYISQEKGVGRLEQADRWRHASSYLDGLKFMSN